MKPAFWRYLLPVILWCSLIFVFSHQPKEESEEYSKLAVWILKLLGIDLNAWTMGNATMIVRKGAHITEYFILASLVLRYLRNRYSPLSPQIFSFGLIFSVLYAATDEFHQTFIPGRVGCLEDVMIDSIGIILVGVTFFLITRKK